MLEFKDLSSTPALTCMSCVTLGKSLPLSEPPAPFLQNRTKLPLQRKAVKEWAKGCGSLWEVCKHEASF